MSTVTGFHLEQGRTNHIYQFGHVDGCPLVRRKGPDPFLHLSVCRDIRGSERRQLASHPARPVLLLTWAHRGEAGPP